MLESRNERAPVPASERGGDGLNQAGTRCDGFAALLHLRRIVRDARARGVELERLPAARRLEIAIEMFADGEGGGE